jgi:hypothetical protein
MRKFETLTVVIAGFLVAASIANAVFFPVPSGPIRACPFGAIWAVIWKLVGEHYGTVSYGAETGFGMAACSARATSGQTSALPRAAMNSRRFIRSPRRRARAGSAAP